MLIGLLAQVKVAARAMWQFAAVTPVSGGHEKYWDEANAHAKNKRRRWEACQAHQSKRPKRSWLAGTAEGTSR